MFNKSGYCYADDSGRQGCTAYLTDESTVQREGSSESARLHALLTTTKMKESSILHAIEKLGGGPKGLSNLVKAVLFWLGAQHRRHAESREERAPEIVSPWTEEIDYLLNLPCGDNDGSLSDKETGVQGGEKQSQSPESGSLAGLSDGLISQRSSRNLEDISSGDWMYLMPECAERHQRTSHAGLIKNTSPDQSASLQCANNLIAFCDTPNGQSNMWGPSPSHVGYPSPDPNPSYLNYDLSCFDEMENDVPVTPSGHFDVSPSSPLDFQSPDFSLFLRQGPMSFGENIFPPGISSSSLQSTNYSHESCSKPRRPAYTIKDLQFLLQKVLRPSDLGKMGRIVLSKKDAESRLPRLDVAKGVQFPCKDYDTGEMMLLRYRFWPNHRSRMYLLENTRHFIKKHHLLQNDKMLLYRNKQSGSYVIRAGRTHNCLDGLQIVDQKKPSELLKS